MSDFEELIRKKEADYMLFVQHIANEPMREKMDEKWKNESFFTTKAGERYYMITSEDPMFEKFQDVAVNFDFGVSDEVLGMPELSVLRERLSIPHMHDFFELFYVYQGSCEIVMSGKRERLNAGDFCICNLHVLHQVKMEEGAIGINILIQKSAMQQVLLGIGSDISPMFSFFINSIYSRKSDRSFMIYEHLQDTLIAEYIKTITLCFFENEKYANAVMRSRLVCLFADLSVLYQDRLRESQMGGQLEAGEVLQYLQNNYMEATLASTAEKFHYSVRYMSGFIKKNTGFSFPELMQEIRLDAVKKLLLQPEYSIERITQMAGYKERSYLDRLFKKKYGLTTAQFRTGLSQT